MCSIAVYFYESCSILASLSRASQNTNDKHLKHVQRTVKRNTEPVKPVLWSKNNVRYLYSLRALFVFHEAELDNYVKYFHYVTLHCFMCK